MRQTRADELLDALAEGTITAPERAELDRLAAVDPAVARARDAELLIGETFAAADGPSGPTTPGADLLARFSAPPAPAVMTGGALALALAAAAIVGIVIGVVLFTPDQQVPPGAIVRHDTIVRLAPVDSAVAPVAPLVAEDSVSVGSISADSVARPVRKRRVESDDDSPAPAAEHSKEIEPEADDELIINPEIQLTDTVRGRARVRPTDKPE